MRHVHPVSSRTNVYEYTCPFGNSKRSIPLMNAPRSRRSPKTGVRLMQTNGTVALFSDWWKIKLFRNKQTGALFFTLIHFHSVVISLPLPKRKKV